MTLERSLYTRPPILKFRAAIALANALSEACPKRMPKAVRSAAQALGELAESCKEAGRLRGRELGTARPAGNAELDVEADNIVAALKGRLDEYARLPQATFPNAARADALSRLLFGETGLRILKLPYAEQAVAMESLLTRINEEQLAKELNELAGADFLAALRAIVPRYQDMVSAMANATRTSAVDKRALVRRLQDGIFDYTLQVLAATKRDDVEAEARAAAALLPLDNYRVRSKRGGASAEGEDADEGLELPASAHDRADDEDVGVAPAK